MNDLIGFISLAFLTVGVTYCSSDDVPKRSTVTSDITNNLTYHGQIKNMIKSKCESCHITGNDLPKLSLYTEVKDAGEKIITVMFTEHKGIEWNGSELAVFKRWKELGYPEGIAAEDNSADPAVTLTYELNVKPIIAAKCVSCHSLENIDNAYDPPLNTYFFVAEMYSEIVADYLKVADQVHIPANRLTEAEFVLFQKWFDGGKIEK